MYGECTLCRFLDERLLSPYALKLKEMKKKTEKGGKENALAEMKTDGEIESGGHPKRRSKKRTGRGRSGSKKEIRRKKERC